VARRSFRLFKFLFILGVLAGILYLARPLWLRAVGWALVHDDGPAKADIAVVLAGDYYGNRIRRAADLVRQGYVSQVLVDGPTGFYGTHESLFAIQYAVSQGYPASWFVDFPINATSTREEAALVLPELRRRNIHSYLLVTSDFHSGRAGRIFRATQKSLGYNPEMRVVISRGPDFNPDTWWHFREGRKAAFIEWWKTLATAAGQ
jgi:uncharacterized SAM-binding protein YcdF (DUF218 family)